MSLYVEYILYTIYWNGYLIHHLISLHFHSFSQSAGEPNSLIAGLLGECPIFLKSEKKMLVCLISPLVCDRVSSVNIISISE